MGKKIAAFVSKRPRLTEDRQRSISETVVNERKVFRKLRPDDQEIVMQYVNDHGVRDAIKECNIVQYLDMIAKEKGIEHSDQVAIIKTKFGKDIPFAGLTADEALHIFNHIEHFGHTRLINDATGQTDITDSIKDDDLSAEPEPIDESKEDDDLIEIQADSGEWIEITPEFKQRAMLMRQRLDAAVIIQALVIKKIKDEKYYMAYGYSSFSEFCSMSLPFNRQTAYKYLAIGDSFGPFLPDSDESVSSMRQLETIDMGKLSELGVSKLYELSRIDDADFSEAMETGTFKLSNGNEVSVDEIKSQTAREFAKKMKELRESTGKRISRLKEDAEKAKEERDGYKQKIEDKQELINRAEELEARHGEAAARLEERHESMDIVMRHISAAEEALAKVNLDEGDPDSIKERFQGMMKTINRMHRNAIDRNSWIHDVVSETPIQPLKKDTA